MNSDEALLTKHAVTLGSDARSGESRNQTVGQVTDVRELTVLRIRSALKTSGSVPLTSDGVRAQPPDGLAVTESYFSATSLALYLQAHNLHFLCVVLLLRQQPCIKQLFEFLHSLDLLIK